MKRFILLAFLALACFASASEAQVLGEPVEIRWIKTRKASGTSTNSIKRDTALTVLQQSKSDTTATFDLTGCYFNPGVSDSIPLAWILFESDTSVAFTANVTLVTLAIDLISTGSKSATQIAQHTIPMTSGDLFFKFPLWIAQNEFLGVTPVGGVPSMKTLAYPFVGKKLRIRIQTTTGNSSIPSCRASILKVLGPAAR